MIGLIMMLLSSGNLLGVEGRVNRDATQLQQDLGCLTVTRGGKVTRERERDRENHRHEPLSWSSWWLKRGGGHCQTVTSIMHSQQMFLTYSTKSFFNCLVFTAKKIKIDEHLYTISLDVQEKFCTVFWVTRVYPVILQVGPWQPSN